TVEIDETYIGGRQRGRKGMLTNKDMVLGIQQRGGPLHLVKIKDVCQPNIYKEIAKQVETTVARIVTDESNLYHFLPKTEYKHAKHQTVNHSRKEYVRGDVYTNTIESAFSLLKRAVIGTYHQLSIKHLQRYLDEFSYRFNRREIPDRFEQTVARLAGFKPMPYSELVS